MTTSLRVEYRLNQDENFSPWKKRIMLLLEKFELWDIVEKTGVPPTDPKHLVKFKKKNIKAKRIIIDAIKDHLIPHITGKTRDF